MAIVNPFLNPRQPNWRTIWRWIWIPRTFLCTSVYCQTYERYIVYVEHFDVLAARKFTSRTKHPLLSSDGRIIARRSHPASHRHTTTATPCSHLVVNLRDQALFVADRVGGCCGRKVNVSKCICSNCLIFFRLKWTWVHGKSKLGWATQPCFDFPLNYVYESGETRRPDALSDFVVWNGRGWMGYQS